MDRASIIIPTELPNTFFCVWQVMDAGHRKGLQWEHVANEFELHVHVGTMNVKFVISEH